MNKRKIYERTFKEHAVQLSMERSDLGNLARELGISVKLLYNWRNEFKLKGKESFPGNGKQAVNPQAKDLLTLQKEYARLQQEHEILKKAIGIISKSGL
jgi:transposase